jgi:hypothetical protein
LLTTLADTDSVLELRRDFGCGDDHGPDPHRGAGAFGVVANNPMHLGGAIDSDGADKAARFMQLCDAFDIPLLFLCDTPGNMVGPEAERTATGPALLPALRHRRERHGAFFTVVSPQGPMASGAQAMRAAASTRPSSRCPGHRRVRRHGGSEGRGQARLPQRAGGHRRPRRAQAVSTTRATRPCTEQGKALNARRLSRSTT